MVSVSSFQCEVAGVQEMNLGAGNLAPECQCAFDREQLIIFAPHNQNRRAMDRIQLELMFVYRTNVASYPRWQTYLQCPRPVACHASSSFT